VLPLGGGHVTNDIATVLRTPLDSAEKIKRKYGCAWRGLVDDGDKMEVPSVGGRGPRVMLRKELVAVIEPRIEEIFEHIKKELMRSGYFDSLAAGVVLTGGATAMEGVGDIAEQVLGLPTRRGAPTKIGGLVDVVRSPAYSTGVGLVCSAPIKARPCRCPRAATIGRGCSSARGAGSPRCSSAREEREHARWRRGSGSVARPLTAESRMYGGAISTTRRRSTTRPCNLSRAVTQPASLRRALSSLRGPDGSPTWSAPR